MSRAHVLVVDDNDHNREYARQVLADRFEVSLAVDGVDALEQIAAHAPDLLVLDLSMPRLDGWGVLARLRAAAATRELPVVACSAHAMSGDRERALAAGFNAYVAKPYRGRELIACVHSFLPAVASRERTPQRMTPSDDAPGADDWGGEDWSLSDDDWAGS